MVNKNDPHRQSLNRGHGGRGQTEDKPRVYGQTFYYPTVHYVSMKRHISQTHALYGLVALKWYVPFPCTPVSLFCPPVYDFVSYHLAYDYIPKLSEEITDTIAREQLKREPTT